MFVRLLELDCKSGKAGRVRKSLEQKVSVLKAQPGFVDAIILKSDTDENRLLGLSIWKNKKHAERYGTTQYPLVEQIIGPMLQAAPRIETFDLAVSTAHLIASQKAAKAARHRPSSVGYNRDVRAVALLRTAKAATLPRAR
jgi:quinol monooxygenase YgiN